MKNNLFKKALDQVSANTTEKVKKYTDMIDEIDAMKNQILFENISLTQLSIARHYGGIKVNGVYYFYIPDKDALLRKDWVKKLAASKKRRETWNEFIEEIRKIENE